jgi:peptidoglycan/LPS O-acetylase OafA/YrhL
MTLAVPFRPDINGLRAWAVCLVLLYHFDVPGFSGGFLGVDVFFAISGYLMAAILLGSQSPPNIAQFWLARATRIVPALAALVALLLAAGWFALPAPEYRLLGAHALASLSFVSNHSYASEAGYFDVSAHDKWLLHSWSLSVEFQFYLAFPLLLFVLRRWAPSRLPEILVLLASLSWLACLLVTPVEPAQAFYLFPFRAWELLAGACLFLWRLEFPPRAARGLEVTGLAVVVLCSLALTPAMVWPGLLAGLPVIGALMVLSGREGTVLTTHHVAQWIGDRSYSLYLWHWPVVVAMGYLPREASMSATLLGITLSVLLAMASHRFLERPRLPRKFTPRVITLSVLLALPLALGSCVWIWQGLPGRVPPEAESAAREAWNRSSGAMDCEARDGLPGRFCRQGDGPLAAVLVGDSHADALAGALAEAAGPGRAVARWTYPSCLVLVGAQVVPGVMRSGERCTEFTDEVRRRVAALPPGVPVVLASRTSAYVIGFAEPDLEGQSRPALHFGTVHASANAVFGRELAHAFARTACEFGRDRPVFLVAPVPEMPMDVPRAVSRALVLGIPIFPSVSEADYRVRNRLALAAMSRAARDCAARILDPLPPLCAEGRCRSTEGERPLYYDDDHLSEFGNRKLLTMLAPIFEPDEPQE